MIVHIQHTLSCTIKNEGRRMSSVEAIVWWDTQSFEIEAISLLCGRCALSSGGGLFLGDTPSPERETQLHLLCFHLCGCLVHWLAT